jgi:diadenosine tetraphosphate (Ap4A) HIT family hydrolase
MKPAYLLSFVFLVPALLAAEPAKPKCVFCGIAAGVRDAAFVHRDDTVMAIMDIDPVNPGHTLVIPVAHANGLLDLPPDTAKAMMALAQRVARAIQSSDLKAEGIQLRMNTGAAAGQTVGHAHLHVIPRFAKDTGPDIHPGRAKPPRAELDAAAAKIKAALQKL